MLEDHYIYCAMMRLLPSCISGPSRHRVSAHSTRLRLYVRQPGGWFCYIEKTQRINYQIIAINLTHWNSCQVVCFFIGPGGYRLLQCTDIQHYRSFITRQVVWKIRNVASEHINIVKRRKTLWERKRILDSHWGIFDFSDSHSRSLRCFAIRSPGTAADRRSNK